MTFSGRASQSLDNFITGHYGEDQFRGFPCDGCIKNDECEIVDIKEPCSEFTTHHGSLTTPGPIHFGKRDVLVEPEFQEEIIDPRPPHKRSKRR